MAAGTDLRIRPIVREDAAVLFRWLNTADRRETSFQTADPVPWEAHVEWLNRRLADPDCWLAMALHDGHPAGQVRVERDNDSAVISVYVDAEFRRRGVGRVLVEEACKAARAAWPGLPILAHVRADNPRSIAFFRSNGFSDAEQHADRFTLRRT